MKQFHFLIGILALTVSALSAAGEGGAGSTGGGDRRDYKSTSAVFAGALPIPYCIKRKEGFPLTVLQSRTAFEEAAQEWKNLFENVAGGGKAIPNFAFQYGPCGEKIRLTLYLGFSKAEDPALESLWHGSDGRCGGNPQAGSVQLEHDFESGLGRALIWVADPESIESGLSQLWQRIPEILQAHFLHQLGHLQGGTVHVPGTIMAEDYQSLFKAPNGVHEEEKLKKKLRTIEHERFLLEMARGTLGWNVAINVDAHSDSRELQMDFLKSVFGVSHRSEVKEMLFVNYMSEILPNYYFVMLDGPGVILEYIYTSSVDRFTDYDFHVELENRFQGSYSIAHGKSFFAKLKGQEGRVWVLLITLGYSDTGPAVQIEVWDTVRDEYVPLWESTGVITRF